jgi:hypothetical protein
MGLILTGEPPSVHIASYLGNFRPLNLIGRAIVKPTLVLVEKASVRGRLMDKRW